MSRVHVMMGNEKESGREIYPTAVWDHVMVDWFKARFNCCAKMPMSEITMTLTGLHTSLISSQRLVLMEIKPSRKREQGHRFGMKVVNKTIHKFLTIQQGCPGGLPYCSLAPTSFSTLLWVKNIQYLTIPWGPGRREVVVHMSICRVKILVFMGNT